MSNKKLAILGGPPIRREPYQPIWPSFGKEEEEQLMDVLRISRKGMGKPIGKITEFEERFAAYHNARAAVACTNCSQALEIMLAVAGIRPGDEVIVPPFTYISTAGAAISLGAVPVFADIDPGTYQIDPESIEEMISSRTRAIVPVHFGGHFCDMERIRQIAEKHDLIIIEDAAHAHGAKWNGRYAGYYGLAAGFSFQYGKNMTAQEGGVIISTDADFIERCWEYVWYGRKKGQAWYEHYRITSNYRITEIQAAVLLAQLSKLPEQNKRRSKNGDLLDKYLAGVEGITPAAIDPRTEVHPRHLYPVRFSDELIMKAGSKRKIVDAVNAEGIPLLFGYEFPVYRTPAFLEKSFRAESWYSEVYARIDYGSVHLRQAEQACRDTAWFLHNALLGEEQDIRDIYLALEKVVVNIDELAQIAG